MRKDRNKHLYKRNSFYHIYNRGNHKEKIFFKEDDYKRFCSLMYKYLKRFRLLVVGYCYLPNHFHLVLKSRTDLTAISRFMSCYMTAYVMYFNRKYNKVGHLFQGPFQVRRVRGRLDLHTVLAYLKQNPIEANLVKEGEKYKWLYIRKSFDNAGQT